MPRIFHKSRKYPIIRDEYGRSLRHQAFDLFGEGYRPSRIFKEELIHAPMKTLLRYFEDWKKQRGKTSYSTLKRYLKESPEFSERYANTLANYFQVTPEDIILRWQRPWGIMQLAKGELPDNRLHRIQSGIEDRLEAALRLVYITEQLFHNSPKQLKELIWDIITLRNNTRLVIQKTKGQVLVRKERLQGTS